MSVNNVQPYFSAPDFTLYTGDALQLFSLLPPKSVDLIFADPPYFLSNDGITCQAGKMVSVNKGEWDRSEGVEKDYEFTKAWLAKCYEVLKDEGTIWVSGTLHIIFKIGYAMEELGYSLLNDIIWFKPNAPPNLSCRYFTHSHETLLWAKKSKKAHHPFNYEVMKSWDVSKDFINNQDKQMRSVWAIGLTPQSEKELGKHPTQKPLELLNRIILSSSNEGQLVLDPFSGTATTGIAAALHNRKYIGFEINPEYNEIAKTRYAEVAKQVQKKKATLTLSQWMKVPQ